MTGTPLAAASAPFPRYWTSAFLADFGDGVRLAAFPLLAAHLTGSPAAVAAVTAVQGLPWLVLGLGAGALVDRRDLRATMVGVDLARAVVVAVLALAVATHLASLPLLYLAALVTGTGSMLRDTAAATAVPRVVDPADLERANGRLVAGGLVGNELAGPAAGGWLFGIAAALPFAVNASGLGLAVLLLLTLPGVFGPVAQAPAGRGPRGLAHDVGAGLRHLVRDRTLRDLVGAIALVAAADGGYFAILVVYVGDVLHRGGAAYGALLAVGAVGGVVSGATSARLTRRIGTRGTLVAAISAMAASQLLLGLTAGLVPAAVALAVSSAAFAAVNTTSVSVRQRRAPAGLLGRVNSAYLTVGRAAEAGGALAGGALAALAGVRTPVLAGVVPLLAAAALVGRRGRRGRPGAT